MKRRALRARLLAGLSAAALILMFAAVPALADDPEGSPGVTADIRQAEEAYSDPEYAEEDAFVDEDVPSEGGIADSGARSGALSAYEENNDGDDTYISNDGTTFRIPRVADRSLGVFDFRGIYTAEQQRSLKERIDRLAEKKKCDIFILIPRDVPIDVNNGSETSQKYLRQFYIDNNFGEDGAAFIIDLDNRVLWTIGSGKYRSDKFVDFSRKVYNDCLAVARRGDYYAAAETFLDDFDSFGNPAKAAVPTPLSLLIGGIASLLGMLGLNAQHKHTQPSRATTPALSVRNYRSLRHDERYLGTTVTRRHIPRNDSHGGGGGGFSGGFSSGGFSSGGGSFSGGGGKF